MSFIRKSIPVLLAAVVLLISFGCGGAGELSLSEYQERISELHDDVLAALEDVSQNLDSIPYDDYWGLLELEDVFELSYESFVSAGKEASAYAAVATANDKRAAIAICFMVAPVVLRACVMAEA